MRAIPLDLSVIQAVVFDLDNTLVTSSMNFRALREQIGCPQQDDLLHYANGLNCDLKSQRAHQLIIEHEMEDARISSPMPGCLELLEHLRAHRIHTAIVTRNCAKATALKMTHNHIKIERVISREHFPPKPAPDSLIALAEEWFLPRQQVLYVGDFVYDLQAARNAGMPSCLVTHGRRPDFVDQASLVVTHLHDLQQLLAQSHQQLAQ
ncbi:MULTISPECIES: HAD family hydrolase [unclassified Vibrio]|uniref:HAD family hydrolase n=1 Tax=unclassified Vibrio TaxID=2614977 RepID=UPI001360E9AD|nr:MULTISPECIES: HAD family hydrolase [unclassified Vibrio]NAW58606.1 HAD-IA family hydrolase [Vibrio sp. V36_P2S2PM302]NAX21726.1 HAD-IA family hydrolase [Vibrio sp. V39_P1S14PM300]NAX27490.1 HAD-IA family hydrolase [Vibrio sp. V38_P2S17PM301]NAX30787.1 HAD-IA family hydrolase [Vibrio sp. V37_P2S8PM304]